VSDAGGPLTRGRLLRSGLGVGAVGVAVAAALLGPRAIRSVTGGECGSPGAVPPQSGTAVRRVTLRSRHVAGGAAEIAIARPDGLPARGAPVCVGMPGRGGRGRDVMGVLRMHDFLAQAMRDRGARPFAIVGVDGGETYWHARAGGEDRMAFLEEDVLPYLAREHGLGSGGAPTLLLGWSMGGYGALLAAERRPNRYAALAVASPALWVTRGQQSSAVPDAFDSDADFARHDVIAGAQSLRGVPLRIDCGDADPFSSATSRLVSALPAAPQGGFDIGCHDAGFWHKVAPDQVDFLSGAL
jgi:putative esterase